MTQPMEQNRSSKIYSMVAVWYNTSWDRVNQICRSDQNDYTFFQFFFNTKIKAEFIVKSKIDLVKSRVYDKSKVKISIIIPSDK